MKKRDGGDRAIVLDRHQPGGIPAVAAPQFAPIVALAYVDAVEGLHDRVPGHAVFHDFRTNTRHGYAPNVVGPRYVCGREIPDSAQATKASGPSVNTQTTLPIIWCTAPPATSGP